MKIDRLMGILTILLQRDSITAPQLAARFEVSRRTIGRDIEDLCKAGLPLVTTQGYGGGISLAQGYKLDKTLLTQEELQIILAGLRGMESITQPAHLTSLLEKLTPKDTLLPGDDSIVINLASHYQDTLSPKITAIKKAISQKRRITFLYYNEKGETSRQLEPYRLVFQWGSWYVFGYCLERQDFRLFKLNRLWNLQTQETSFLPRELPRQSLHPHIPSSQETIHLKALFDPREGHRLIDEYGIGCYTVTKDGWLLFARAFYNYTYLRQWVLSFGDRVRVLAPSQLAEDRRGQAQNILSQPTEDQADD